MVVVGSLLNAILPLDLLVVLQNGQPASVWTSSDAIRNIAGDAVENAWNRIFSSIGITRVRRQTNENVVNRGRLRTWLNSQETVRSSNDHDHQLQSLGSLVGPGFIDTPVGDRWGEYPASLTAGIPMRNRALGVYPPRCNQHTLVS